MPFSGNAKNSYWATLGFGGTGTPGMLSEFVSVVLDGVTTYKFQVTAASVANFAGGFSINISWYDVNQSLLSSTSLVNSGALTAGTQVQINTTATTPPSNTAFLQARIEMVGSPATANVLEIFQAEVTTGSNTAQPVDVNSNYSFLHGFYPWTPFNAAILDWNFAPLTTADGDFDSLVIDNTIELMGGAPGVFSSIPELQDPATGRSAIFRIPFTGGNVAVGSGTTGPYDLGAPQPTTDVVESLLLDGERPFGDRASNRTLTLPVLIFAPSLATLAAAREALMRVIDQQTWKLTWRPAETGLALEFDCFRASPTVVTYGFGGNAPSGSGTNPATWAKSLVTLTFQALPYGRSGQDGVQVVPFTDGTLDGGSVTPSVTVDNFASVNTGSTGGGSWSLNTAYAFGSSQSARYGPPVPMKVPYPAAVYTKTGLSLNITGLPILVLWFGQSYDTQWALQKTFASNVTLAWTLTDGNSHTISFSAKQNKCAWGADPNKPAWTRISASIPQGKTKAQFDYANVTGYSVRITNWAGSGTTGYVRMHAWMSQLSASATTTKWVATPHGSVYSVFGLQYMARSPLSAEIQLPAQNPLQHEFTQSNSWTVPRGVTQAAVETWGAGGGGGSVVGIAGGVGGAGGGGGEYAAEAAVTVIPGTLVPFTIGTGGTGGQVVASTATFGHPGSNTWTAPPGVTVVTAQLWGGGAAGGAGAGGGGAGAYTAGTANVTAGKTYTFTVGAGGKPNTGTLSKDQAARHGGDTVVRGDTGAIHALGGSSPVTGGTNGGAGAVRFTTPESGTTITASAQGGAGGNSPGAAGGGGGAGGGSTGNGARGGDSLKGGNNYASGGTGATGAGGGGNGGNGADLNGIPTQGVIPGGGGGGGYTSTVNNNGAFGANGRIIITWQQNLGNPVNGTSTVFGAAGLTNKIVTAHGGGSPSLNSADGPQGGTGSSNTVHFDGGDGSFSGNNLDYLFRQSDNGGPFFKQATATGTGTSLTTGAAATAQITGVSVAYITSSIALDPNVLVSDSAGNVYTFAGKVDVAGTIDTNVFIAKIGAPLTTSSTLTVNNNGVSATFEIMWQGSVQYADVDVTQTVTNTGTSTAPSVTVSNADLGTHKGYIAVIVNNSTTAFSVAPVNPASWTTATSTDANFASGTIQMSTALKEVPGSTGSTSFGLTYGSSVAWAALAIPLIPQDTTEPTLLKLNQVASTGTTSVVPLTNAFPIPAGRGMMLMLVQFAGTPGTITFTDAANSGWAQLASGTVTIGTSVFRAYTVAATNAYTQASTVTLNDTTSQAHNTTLFYVHEAASVDTSLTKTATGTSAAPSITTNAGTVANDFHVVVYANNNTVDTTTTPTGWVNWSTSANGAQHYSIFAKRGHARTTYTPTSAYGTSQTWGAMAFGFVNKILSGSGGAAGGPFGTGQDGSDNGGAGWSGGGKGASGLTGSAGSGAAAAVPGGGGGGAAATDTSSFIGGSGGSGMLRLTWQPPLTTFNDFLIHRPGEGAKRTLCPLVTIPPNDPPDNREYPVPSLVAGRNAEFTGTYSVVVVNNSWNAATIGSMRRVSVTVNQYEYTNGPAVSVQATRVLTPSDDIINGYVTMGEVTLPIKDYDEANDQVYYTVSIHDTDSGDSFQDVIFLDVTGQTCLVNIAPGTVSDGQYATFYVDEPTFDRSLGQVLGTSQGREQSVSVLDMGMLTGGPLYLHSDENLLLVYSTGGAPNLNVTYMPRWYTDRIS